MCYYDIVKKSCDYCCNITEPDEEDPAWDEVECEEDGQCQSGRKKIIVKSKDDRCKDVDFSQEFERENETLMLTTKAVFATVTLMSPRMTVNTFLIYTNKVHVCIDTIFKTGRLLPITAALIKVKIVMA